MSRLSAVVDVVARMFVLECGQSWDTVALSTRYCRNAMSRLSNVAARMFLQEYGQRSSTPSSALLRKYFYYTRTTTMSPLIRPHRL